MGLQTTVASGIATAKSVTASLQDDITIAPWTSNDRTGAPSYGTAVTYPALVEWKQKMLKDRSGRDVVTQTKVTILQPITANGTSGRTEPVDPRDKVTLPDGTVGPILDVAGLVNPDTGYPYMFEIWLGGSKVG